MELREISPCRSIRRLLAAGAFALLLAGNRAGAVDFIRGDVNSDGAVSIADAHFLSTYLFRGGERPACYKTGDYQPDGHVDFSDALEIMNFIFGGRPPAAPFPVPGPDKQGMGDLDCGSYGSGSSLEDPAAKIEVLHAVAEGGTEGLATITIAVSNSTAIAGYSGRILVDSGIIGPTMADEGQDLTGTFNRGYNRTSQANGRLNFGFLSSQTWHSTWPKPTWIPPGLSVPALKITVCLKEGTRTGEYPLTLSAGELVDAASARSIRPALASGTLTVLSTVAPGAGCGTLCPPPPPRPTEPPADFNAQFKLREAAAVAGSTVTIPFSILADADVQGFAFSVDFDEEVLEALEIEKLFQKPNGTDWDFHSLTYNNQNDTPGSGGVDEGYLVGGVVFSMRDACNGIPAARETEVLGFKFRVREDARVASTEVRFIDGAKSPGDRIRNTLTAFGWSFTPETANSFIFLNGRIAVLPEITVFIRADSNGDRAVDLSDAVHTLEFLYRGGEKPFCYDAADANDDGKIDIADPITTLTALFLGSELRFPSPYPEAGNDLTPDDLRCLARLE